MSKTARVQLIAVALVAFASGLVFASGFDLTKLSWAQTKSATPPRPTAQEVRPLEETSQAFEAIAEHVTPAVVSIDAEQLEPRRTTPRRDLPPGMEEFFRRFEGPDQGPRSSGGSGFIVSKDGYILTNNHVVANADRVIVKMLDNRRFEARVIGRDPTTDVALIKVDATNLPAVTLGDDRTARVGQWVVAIGNPLGLDFTVTAGIISAKQRSQLALPGRELYAIQDFIQTDAAINPGNSGGPLVNIRGEVIGINSAIASSTGFNAGYGFAIPISLAKVVMDDLREHGRVRRAVLGVSIAEVEPADARAAGLTDIRGAKIQDFTGPDSPSLKAGIEVGDIIIAAAGQRVNRVSELQRIIREHKPGEVVDVEVMRFGKKHTFRVRLAEPPAEREAAVATRDRDSVGPAREGGERSYEKLGITVQPVPTEVRDAIDASTQVSAAVRDAVNRGLYVTAVSARGPAYRGLVPRQDVIVRALNPVRRDIRSATDLEEVVRGMRRGDVLSLLVYSVPGRATKVVNVPIE